MRFARPLVTAMLTAAILAVAAPAFGYSNEATPGALARLPLMKAYLADPGDPDSWTMPDPTTDCWLCHGSESADERSGPHGGYTTATSKCATCHSVHQAPAGGVMLLPALTIKDTCETCHDGTGGRGVYGTIAARGLPVVSAHRIISSAEPSTTTIPGGDAETGGSREGVFSGVGGNLTCTDCHSPHGGDIVEPFTGDRVRASVDSTVTSSRLLRSWGGEIPRYGSDWCGKCHAGRLSGSSATGNHPVESSITQTQTVPFDYENIVRVTGVLASTVETGTLGRNNFGYVMPDDPRDSLQAGRYPICQQCHEDSRSVGDVGAQQIASSELYTVTTAYSTTVVGDNPEFQVFPHESTNRRLLVETDDDLCLNCHKRP